MTVCNIWRKGWIETQEISTRRRNYWIDIISLGISVRKTYTIIRYIHEYPTYWHLYLICEVWWLNNQMRLKSKLLLLRSTSLKKKQQLKFWSKRLKDSTFFFTYREFFWFQCHASFKLHRYQTWRKTQAVLRYLHSLQYPISTYWRYREWTHLLK